MEDNLIFVVVEKLEWRPQKKLEDGLKRKENKRKKEDDLK